MEPQRQLLHGSYRQIPRFRAYHEHTDPHGKRRDWKWTAITLKPAATASYTFFFLLFFSLFSFFFFFFQTRLLSYFSRSASNFRFNRTLPAVSPTNFRPRAIFQIPVEFAREMNSTRSFPLKKKNNFFRERKTLRRCYHILIEIINFPLSRVNRQSRLFLLKCSFLS